MDSEPGRHGRGRGHGHGQAAAWFGMSMMTTMALALQLGVSVCGARVIAHAGHHLVEHGPRVQPDSHTRPYTVTVSSYPEQPALNYETHTTDFQLAYNPAYLPPSSLGQDQGPAAGATKEGLLVRAQNHTTNPVGVCGAPLNGTSVAVFARLGNDSTAPATVGHLFARNTVFGPAMTPYEQTAEDPRVVLHNGTYFMTYTANGDTEGAKPPMNRHQGIATCTQRCHEAGSWTRRCTASRPCLTPGVKSGAMLPATAGARGTGVLHHMFVYDLRPVSSKAWDAGQGRDTVIALSHDLITWQLLNKTLLPRRPGRWDEGLIEPGPPPLLLSDGNHIFFYNGATVRSDRQYHVGYAVLSARDPTVVLQRSEDPVLSWSDRPWMAGNATNTTTLCYTPTVVFCNGARALGGDRFELFFGGADAVVGTAILTVDTPTAA